MRRNLTIVVESNDKKLTQLIKKKLTISYGILLKKEPEGGYTATVSSLPGCCIT